MIEYKRLADVKTVVELDYIVDEWVDRFAKPPESVENLVKLIRLRLSATEVKIAVWVPNVIIDSTSSLTLDFHGFSCKIR